MNGRPSFFRLAIRQFWLLFGSIWLLVGAIFLVVGGAAQWKDYRYRHEGVRTDAEVVDKARRSGDSSTNYVVVYRFTARDGVIYEGTDSLAFSTWDRLKEGDRVAVVYLPDKPDSNRLEGSNEWLLSVIFCGIGGVFAPIGGALVVRSIFKVRRNLRLMSEGVRVEATVVGVQQTNMRINNVRQWVVRYAYTDMIGQRHEAESDYMSPEEAQCWKEGDTGVVRYDQFHPATCVWLGREDSF